jgi:hypothetical protein
MSYMKYLREDQWERIKGILPGKDRDVGVTAHDNRRFVEGVIWEGRNGGTLKSFILSLLLLGSAAYAGEIKTCSFNFDTNVNRIYDGPFDAVFENFRVEGRMPDI